MNQLFCRRSMPHLKCLYLPSCHGLRMAPVSNVMNPNCASGVETARSLGMNLPRQAGALGLSQSLPGSKQEDDAAPAGTPDAEEEGDEKEGEEHDT